MPVRNPLQALIVAFVAWKAFLLAIAAGSCFGVAYDTSASLALDGAGVGNSSTPTLITRLTSWDAVYFTQIARRGYLFEQEWAFGSGLPITISYFSKGWQHISDASVMLFLFYSLVLFHPRTNITCRQHWQLLALRPAAILSMPQWASLWPMLPIWSLS